MQVPYYVVFDHYDNDRLRVFQLVRDRYREQIVTDSRIWIPELELGLGLWFGSYNGCDRQWLRWYDADGNWIATPEERAESTIQQVEAERIAKESAMQQVEEERIAKESAMQRSALLAERLKAMGINPDEL